MSDLAQFEISSYALRREPTRRGRNPMSFCLRAALHLLKGMYEMLCRNSMSDLGASSPSRCSSRICFYHRVSSSCPSQRRLPKREIFQRFEGLLCRAVWSDEPLLLSCSQRMMAPGISENVDRRISGWVRINQNPGML